ncbi:MAG TPA: metallophosphoesterase [Saprospiraceae bacterium]|nr:metallophosphoesterase [Saprospiraceae bacterium]
MKIQIISDLHLEFGEGETNFEQADVVILAGDTHVGTKGVEWVKAKIPDKPVIYLLGNHEYYNGSYPKTLHQITDAAKDTNVLVLENKRIEIEGITFHGATLWTDFALYGNPFLYGTICQLRVNDFKRIRRDPSYSKMRSVDIAHIHQHSKFWLAASLEESATFKNIVITHHAPSLQSVPEMYKDDPVTSAYASHLEDFILEYQPEYWIHGHIHTPVKYEIGKTRIICNPHGYIDEPYNGFEKELIVEI